MKPADRRTIDELITRYEFEPELRDLYVEGPGDKLLFDWFFKEFGCESIAVFEIECVDIPKILIKELELQQRNRDKVVALSLEFEHLLQEDVQYLLCIADSDFDFLLGRKYNSRYLLYTDYTSVDLYFCSEHILEKLLMLGIRRVPCDTTALLANLAEVLQEVFLIRAANEKLGWGLHWVKFTRCCCIEKNLVVFDWQEFIERYLSKNGRRGDREEFNETCDKLRAIEVQTFKYRIRGRDYLELMGWYISKIAGKGGSKYRDSEVIRAMICPAVDAKSLANEELFKQLLERYTC